MCGIVGTAGNLLAMDEKIFTELLFADVVRGKHATGVATVKGKCREVNVHKRALPAPLYLELGSVATHLARFTQNTVVLGHNRHATKGNSSDPEGAHPFTHGHITLVHNGSLTTHASLTTENFTVDSEAICKAISVDGIEVVAPKLRGAFALVWINEEDNTLNFLRNGEREFAIAWNETSGRMWWASEKRMLEWSLNRDTFTRTPVPYNECFELPVGKWISIPITHVGIDLSERKEIDLDVSNSTYTYNYTGYNNTSNNFNKSKSTTDNVTDIGKHLLEQQASSKPVKGEEVTPYKFGETRETALKKITAGIVSEKGLNNFMIRSFVASIDMNTDAAILDERLGVFITNWTPYSATTSKLGTLHGQLMEYPYADVVVHGFSEEEYDKLYDSTDGMITCYLAGFIVPMASKITIKKGEILSEDDLRKFSLILRKDSIRKADINDFYWDIDQMPAEDVNVLKKAADIDAGLEPTHLTKDVSLKLSDGSAVSVGGTAVFTGTSSGLTPDLRYKIVDITRQETNNTMLLKAKLGDSTYIYSSDKWKEGKVSKDTIDTVLGPDGEYVSVGKWNEAVARGCCHCEEVPTDTELAETLQWAGDRFMCGPCVFELANIRYS